MSMDFEYLMAIGMPVANGLQVVPAVPAKKIEERAKDCPLAAPAILAKMPTSARAPEAPEAPALAGSALVLTAEEERLAEAMCRPLQLRDPASEVSVVSFNMLLKGFAAKHYYPSVPPEVRAWPHRKKQLNKLLIGVDADIYCMQEVECLTFEEEFSFLATAGYGSIAPKDDSKGKRPDMAKTAIFYKGDRLQKLWHETRSRLIIAAFKHLGSGEVLYVVSCHLEGAPWQGATRFTQTQNALESIRKNQRQQGFDPSSSAVIFAGDFNEGDEGAVCRALLDGGLSTAFRHPSFPDVEVVKDDYAHEFLMSDLYVHGVSGEAGRPATFCAPAEDAGPGFAAIDFVFFTHNTLQPTAVRTPFTEEQMRATTGVYIPAPWHFSDHVPVGGVFQFLASVPSRTRESVPAAC